MSPRSLVLNFAPVHLVGEKSISVGHRPYDEDLLRELRSEFRATHIFKRQYRDNEILDVPIMEGAEPLSDNIRTIDLNRSKHLYAPLLNAVLLRSFDGQRKIIGDYPVEILGSQTNNYIQHEELPDWVQIFPSIEFTPRTLYTEDGRVNFGVLCDTRTRSMLLANGIELMAKGLSLVGRYVMTSKPANDTRLVDRTFTVGRVRLVDGENLVLEDHRDGFATIPLKDAYLTANRVDFDWCVAQLAPKVAGRILSDARQKISLLKSGPGRQDMIRKVLNYLKSTDLNIMPGLRFELDNWLSSGDEQFPEVEVIDKPALVFDPAGMRKNKWNEKGIKDNGPYDQRSFTPKRLNIAVICQAKFEGQVDKFIAKFLDGMPETLSGPKGRQQARYGDGFIRRYKLEHPDVQTFITDTDSLLSYQSACEEALQSAANNEFDWDLAIVQIDESFKILPGAENPYYGSKAILLRNNVAVQNIRIETMRDKDSSLVFTMNQLSLAIYAKLGGRPWLLSAQQSVAHELVIGLGSHTESSGRFETGKRHVGITTVFSCDGGYHLCERTGVVNFEEYASALTDTLKRTIQRVREEDNWKSTDRVRLVFHMFKPPKDIEAESIKAAVEALKIENVTFAFLHIAPNHPFVIFDNAQAGLPLWERDPQKKKGVLGPSRGLHLKLGDYESLVVFAGASELKKASDGLPKACLLKLHRNSTFRDMTYLARQAFDFTAHSWRVMTPEAFPVTIKYSDLIAERLAGLKHIEGWDDGAVKFRGIGRTPWFL